MKVLTNTTELEAFLIRVIGHPNAKKRDRRLASTMLNASRGSTKRINHWIDLARAYDEAGKTSEGYLIRTTADDIADDAFKMLRKSAMIAFKKYLEEDKDDRTNPEGNGTDPGTEDRKWE